MSDAHQIAVIVEQARTIFKNPELDYDPDLVFQDIMGFDSVRAVQFILAIEAALDVMFDEEEIDDMRTMGVLMDMLRAKQAS